MGFLLYFLGVPAGSSDAPGLSTPMVPSGRAPADASLASLFLALLLVAVPPSTLLWPGPAPSVAQIEYTRAGALLSRPQQIFLWPCPPHEVIPQERILLVDTASQDWGPVSVHGMKVVAALMLGLLVTWPLTSLNLRFFLFSRFRVILTHLMLDPDIYVHGFESLSDMVGI